MLTVFTPTYNRADLLPRLYESLIKQSSKDFEWLIVDDGSTDNTEDVVKKFMAENRINIRYLKKENGGKHTAHNIGIQQALGEYFFCVDSDDWLSSDAVKNILETICQMTDSDYCLMGYKALENTDLICKPFSEEMAHLGFYRLTKLGMGGEYSIVMKTQAIKSHPFPEIKGEHFSTESVLYDYMELVGYTVCPCPYILTFCEYQEDGLTGNIVNCLKQSPTAYQIYHFQRIDLVDTFKERLCHALKYHAFKSLSGNRQYTYKGHHRLLTVLTALPGKLCSLYYKLK